MGDLILLSNLSRPLRLIELSNATQMASRTLAENTRNAHRSSICFCLIGFNRRGRSFAPSASASSPFAAAVLSLLETPAGSGCLGAASAEPPPRSLRLFPEQIVLVVAVVAGYRAAFHFQHPRGQPVDEVPVVRDKNHCAAESRLKRKTLLKLQGLVPAPVSESLRSISPLPAPTAYAG